VSGGVENDVYTFIDEMVNIGTGELITRADYSEVFTPAAAVVAAAPVVGKKEETPDEAEMGTITLSSQFTTMEHALFSCPNHEDHCGTGMRDATSSSVTLSP